MKLQDCIDRQDLKKYALGYLDDDRSGIIAAHLSECPQCEETMAGFDDTGDSLLKGVREAAVSADLDSANSPADASPADAVLQQIRNPWEASRDNEKARPPGEWIRDYELLEQLGQGGMGTVYKAVHARLQRTVAIKLLPSRRLRDPDAVGRFEREMRAIGRLDHPAIVRATDAGDADGTHFLVMDFVEGIDLSRLMKLSGPMDVASACEVVRQVAIALQYAHDQGLIHRDVKPSNLMVEISQRDGHGNSSAGKIAVVKLLDLGLALFGAASEAVDELTTVGQLMGTLDYMAPEQADNSHDVDARADVYSLGATMFKLLTGTAPYETSERRTPLQKMKALATIDAPSVKTRLSALPGDVATIVDRMLLRDAALRYQIAAEVAQAVAPFCVGHRLVELTQQAQCVHHALRDEPSLSPVVMSITGSHKGIGVTTAEVGTDAVARRSATWFPGRYITRSVMATLGAIIIVAGIIIRIQTDTGTLVIECAASDVPIEIRQGRDTIKQLSLVTGENKVTLRSGSYEIVLPAKYDSLTLESGKFELSRGGECVAKISESVGAVAQPDNVEFTKEMPISEMPIGNILSRLGITVGQAVTPDVAQFISDPIQQIEFERLSNRYSELLRKIDELRDAKAEAAVKYGENHPKVVPLIVSRDQAEKESAAVREAMKQMLEEVRLLDEARMIAHEKGREAAKSPATDGPLYAGKTFDQWLEVVKTERSTEELTKAIEALGVLGRETRQMETVDAVFEVVERYPIHVEKRAEVKKLFARSIQIIRSFLPSTIVPTIKMRFVNGNNEAQSFVLDSNLSLLAPFAEVRIDDETFQLGEYRTFVYALSQDAEFVQAMVQEGPQSMIWLGERIQSQLAILEQHTVKHKPSEAVKAFLNRQLINPETLRQNDRMPDEAIEAARILIRNNTDVKYANIFVRAIEDDIRAAGLLSSERSETQLQVPFRLEPWNGLKVLRRAATPALPLMYKILREPPEAKASVSSPIVTDVFQDISGPGRFQINLRLLAIETIALTATQDPVALDLIRAELNRLMGQSPVERLHEVLYEYEAGRHELLLGCHLMFLNANQVPDARFPYSPVEIELTNSCLLAFEAITGNAASFDSPSVGDISGRISGAVETTYYLPRIVRYKNRTSSAWVKDTQPTNLSPTAIYSLANSDLSAFKSGRIKEFIWLDFLATNVESAIADGRFLLRSEDKLNPESRFWPHILGKMEEVDPDRSRKAITNGCKKAVIDVRIKCLEQFLLSVSISTCYSLLRDDDFLAVVRDSIREWPSLSPEQQAILLEIEDRIARVGRQMDMALLVQLLQEPNGNYQTKAAEILTRMKNIPDALRSEVITILMDAIESSTTTQEVVGPVVGIARIAERGLSVPDLERLMAKIESDCLHPIEIPAGVAAGFSDTATYEYDRRTLLADLIGNYCVENLEVRYEFAERLLALRLVKSFGDEPQLLESLLADREVIDLRPISSESSNTAFIRSVKANVTRLVPTDKDRAMLVDKAVGSQ